MEPKSACLQSGEVALREAFALDPDWLHANHGSFGARLNAVLSDQDTLRRYLEQNPTRWLVDEWPTALERSRLAVGKWLGAAPGSLAFFPSVTQAMNTAIAGFVEPTKGTVLVTDQGYGAVDRAFRYATRKYGGNLHRISVPNPFRKEVFLARWEQALNRGVNLAVIDHITSPTGIELPVQEAVQGAAAKGIPVIVDGAHAPGQLPLQVDALGAAAYVGSLHKWGCGPLGSAFLSMPGVERIDPLVVGWGWEPEADFAFPTAHDWPGTFDPSGWASLPAWLSARDLFNLDDMTRPRACAREFEAQVAGLSSRPLPRGDSPQTCMVAVEVASPQDALRIRTVLKEEHHCMINAASVGPRGYVRMSFYHYNTQEDAERLLALLQRVGAFA